MLAMKNREVNFKLSDAELEAFKRSSQFCGLSLSAWIRSRLLTASRQDDIAARELWGEDRPRNLAQCEENASL